jgi:DNA-binding transcriptional LysR family regulator
MAHVIILNSRCDVHNTQRPTGFADLVITTIGGADTVKDFERMDWNMVPALQALLIERNVSRAARRLGVSQPSASNSLAKLRRYFDDELLVRQGNGYELTPLGARLVPLVQEAVAAARNIVEASRGMEPRESTHEFSIATTDYGQWLLGPRLVRELAVSAPGVRVNFHLPHREPTVTPEGIFRRADGWLAPRNVLTTYASTGLLSDRWVCVVSADHPTVVGDLDPEQLADLEWVCPSLADQPVVLRIPGIPSFDLAGRIRATSDSFSAVMGLVGGTERIGFMPEKLAHHLAPGSGVRIVPCPWEVPDLAMTMWWATQTPSDPVQQWFRDLVTRCMGELAEHSPA